MVEINSYWHISPVASDDDQELEMDNIKDLLRTSALNRGEGGRALPLFRRSVQGGYVPFAEVARIPEVF